MTYYDAMSLQRLGEHDKARNLFAELLEHGRRLARQKAKIDYFATSLPTMLLFNDDLEKRKDTTAAFLQAQALQGLGRTQTSRKLLDRILKLDPNHALAEHFRFESELLARVEVGIVCK